MNTKLIENRSTPLSIDQSKLFIIIAIGRSGSQILLQIMKTFDGCSGKSLEAREPRESAIRRLSLYRYVTKSNDFRPLEKFILENWVDEYFVEKTPTSIFCLPQIQKKFPLANYIFLERHPMKILLSLLNFVPAGDEDIHFRKRSIINGSAEENDLLLNPEVFHSKQILKSIKLQKTYKSLFENQITIRYENFVEHFESTLKIIGKKFGIKPNIDLAKKVFSKPSGSSINNTYFIKSISDEQAIKNIAEACKLWNYDN